MGRGVCTNERRAFAINRLQQDAREWFAFAAMFPGVFHNPDMRTIGISL